MYKHTVSWQIPLYTTQRYVAWVGSRVGDGTRVRARVRARVRMMLLGYSRIGALSLTLTLAKPTPLAV